MSFEFRRAALGEIARSAGMRTVLGVIASQVRDRARRNAASIAGPDKTSAIAYELGTDADGAFADVGYLRHHPGFVLWWAEVGTRNQRPTPHLRPAVKPGRF